MATLLVFEFPSIGPFGAEATQAYRELAEDIAKEEGLLWKVWTEDTSREVAGGVYLFINAEHADRYTEKHTERLAGFGITGITATQYDVNTELSAINHMSLQPGAGGGPGDMGTKWGWGV